MTSSNAWKWHGMALEPCDLRLEEATSSKMTTDKSERQDLPNFDTTACQTNEIMQISMLAVYPHILLEPSLIINIGTIVASKSWERSPLFRIESVILTDNNFTIE